MSGKQWIYLEGIDCFKLTVIGILVLVDNGRQTKQGTLSLRVSGKEERRQRQWDWVMKKRKNRKRQREEGWEKKKQEGNMPGSAVIFTCDSRQQISKDKIFHWMSGHILLCALNSQVFEVAAVSLKKKVIV